MPSDVRDLHDTRHAWPDLSGLADGPPIQDDWRSAPAPGPAWPPPPLPPGPGPHGWLGRPERPAPRRRSAGTTVAILVFVIATLTSALVVGGAAYLVTSPSAKRASVAAPTASTSTLPAPSGGPSGPAPSTAPGAPGQSPPATSPGGAPDWDQVARQVNPGVVNIVSRLDGGVGAGTGMILTADGAILTNNHVVDGADTIAVTLVGTGDTYRASVVGTDPNNDVAVLRLEGASALTPIAIGDSDAVNTGDPVAAIGNAGGRGGTPTVATGKVVALHRTITASEADGSNVHRLSDTIQVDANVQSGDSGGPLVDANAKVIGMNSAASVGRSGRQRSTVHEGYAIPINKALAIGKTLESGGGTGSGGGSPSTTPRSSRGFLGVQSQDGTTGASVLSVQPNSPAAQAGLQAGDEIVGFDGDEITSADDLVAAISQHKPGDRVQITWSTSSGRQQQATITLTTR